MRYLIYKLKEIFALSIIFFSLLSCTIVKNDEQNGKEDDKMTFYFEDKNFNAASFVKNNWDSQILPEIKDKALPLDLIISELKKNRESAIKQYGISKEGSDAYSFLVKGPAEIKQIDRTSSAGLLILETPDLSADGHCAIQIGPVIKKSTIRDTLSFINFGDFDNQIEFANVSREINFFIRDNVVNDIDENYAPGISINFYGAFTINNSEEIIITPVILNRSTGEGQ